LLRNELEYITIKILHQNVKPLKHNKEQHKKEQLQETKLKKQLLRNELEYITIKILHQNVKPLKHNKEQHKNELSPGLTSTPFLGARYSYESMIDSKQHQ